MVWGGGEGGGGGGGGGLGGGGGGGGEGKKHICVSCERYIFRGDRGIQSKYTGRMNMLLGLHFK